MSFFVKYSEYPDKISEVRMHLGSIDKYQTIEAIEKIEIKDENNKDQDSEVKTYEIVFRVVDNGANSVTIHQMSREELGDYINVLRHILSQTK